MTDWLVDEVARARLREVTEAWRELCNCSGPQPTVADLKLDQHVPECPFVAACDPSIDQPAKVGGVDATKTQLS